MVNYILFDDDTRLGLLPFTHTRPVADIRCGIFTMRERWEFLIGQPIGTLTEQYLQNVFPLICADDNIFINGAIFGNRELLDEINHLEPGHALIKEHLVIAARLPVSNFTKSEFTERITSIEHRHYKPEFDTLKHQWDIFSLNGKAIRNDFALVTANRNSAPIPGNILVSGLENIFIEEGAKINMGCIINADSGPVYIGKDAVILEGVMIRGPLAICEDGLIKMGAKIYGATTIGPGCKVGGEINNTVFFANSNKSHDGYLGNSVIGEWCNIGADTNCSNLKNNYDVVKIHSEHTGGLVSTSLTFCGLLMADHSKCGINTMFNTGTVVGVSANIFGGGFPDKFIPSFSWGGGEKFVTYEFEKAMMTAKRMMERRDRKLSDNEIEMYRYIFEHTRGQRA